MLKEAQNPKYQIKAFFLNHFKQLPNDMEFDDLFPVQQEFLMYLTAFAPTIELVQKHIFFEMSKEEINQMDFVDIKPVILKMQAQQSGMTVEEKRDQLNKEARQAKIHELEVKLGYKTESTSSTAEMLMDKYKRVMDRMNKSKIDPKDQTIQNILNNPLKGTEKKTKN